MHRSHPSLETNPVDERQTQAESTAEDKAEETAEPTLHHKKRKREAVDDDDDYDDDVDVTNAGRRTTGQKKTVRVIDVDDSDEVHRLRVSNRGSSRAFKRAEPAKILLDLERFIADADHVSETLYDLNANQRWLYNGVRDVIAAFRKDASNESSRKDILSCDRLLHYIGDNMKRRGRPGKLKNAEDVLGSRALNHVKASAWAAELRLRHVFEVSDADLERYEAGGDDDDDDEEEEEVGGDETEEEEEAEDGAAATALPPSAMVPSTEDGNDHRPNQNILETANEHVAPSDSTQRRTLQPADSSQRAIRRRTHHSLAGNGNESDVVGVPQEPSSVSTRPSLPSLRQHATVEQKRELFMAQLQDWMALSSDYHILVAHSERVDCELGALHDEVEQKNQTIALMETRSGYLENSLLAADSELAALRHQLTDQRSDLDQLAQRLAESTTKLNQFETDAANWASEQGAVSAVMEDLKTKLCESEKLVAKVAELECKAQDSDKLVLDLKVQMTALEKSNTRLREANVHLLGQM